MFLAMKTGVSSCSLSQARFIHFTPAYPFSTILSCHISLGHIRNDSFLENRLSYCLFGRLIYTFGIRYGNGDTCFTVTDFSEPHGVSLCRPLMVLEFIYCRQAPTVVIVRHIAQIRIFFVWVVFGPSISSRRKEYFLQKIHPHLPWGPPSFL
jgi:hypothetical protein